MFLPGHNYSYFDFMHASLIEFVKCNASIQEALLFSANKHWNEFMIYSKSEQMQKLTNFIVISLTFSLLCHQIWNLLVGSPSRCGDLILVAIYWHKINNVVTKAITKKKIK